MRERWWRDLGYETSRCGSSALPSMRALLLRVGAGREELGAEALSASADASEVLRRRRPPQILNFVIGSRLATLCLCRRQHQ